MRERGKDTEESEGNMGIKNEKLEVRQNKKDRERDKKQMREVEAVRHITMDRARAEVEKEGVMEREEEVWKSSHDEMDSTGP